MDSQDRIYALPQNRVGDFKFDESVAEVFPDMISRSVPGYGSIVGMTTQFAGRFAKPNTNVYDLGCSLGASTLQLRESLERDCHLIAVDNSAAMIKRLDTKLRENDVEAGCVVELWEQDIREVTIENASLVILNWTLQFVPKDERQRLLQRVFDGLVQGGALWLSEKIKEDESSVDELLIELHHDFKRANGYSDLEIAQKRTALEKTLLPESAGDHVERMQSVGFTTVAAWFQCFNFASWLAVKS